MINSNVWVSSFVIIEFDLLMKSHNSLIRSCDQHDRLTIRCLKILSTLMTNMSLPMKCYCNILLSASQTSWFVYALNWFKWFQSWFPTVLKVYLLRLILFFLSHFKSKWFQLLLINNLCLFCVGDMWRFYYRWGLLWD